MFWHCVVCNLTAIPLLETFWNCGGPKGLAAYGTLLSLTIGVRTPALVALDKELPDRLKGHLVDTKL